MVLTSNSLHSSKPMPVNVDDCTLQRSNEFIVHFQDDKLVQRAGLLTINLLLNTNQPKKADALVELLQVRLNISSESLTSDEDDDSDVSRGDKKKEKSLKSLDYFKWMFRLYKIRSNVLNVKNLLIPNEDTSEISILRGHQYYNGIDYQMAAKELSKNFSNQQSNIK